jgi:hypothetical protein
MKLPSNLNIKLPNLGRDIGSLAGYQKSRVYYPSHMLAVGTPATIHMWSDTHAATVQEVVQTKAGRTYLKVTRDDKEVIKKAERLGDQPTYKFTPNPEGGWCWAEVVFFKDDKDELVFMTQKADYNPKTKRFTKDGWAFVSLGERREYYDPHF